MASSVRFCHQGQIRRIATTEPTLRDMLQQCRHLFDHLIDDAFQQLIIGQVLVFSRQGLAQGGEHFAWVGAEAFLIMEDHSIG